MLGPLRRFTPKDFRLKRIETLLQNGFRHKGAECNVVCLLSDIRKMLDSEKESQFEFLRFFCNWAVHTEISRSDIPLKVLKKLTTVVSRNNNVLTWVPAFEKMLFSQLRRDLRAFVKKFGLDPGELTRYNKDWAVFLDALFPVIAGAPIKLNPGKQTELRYINRYNGKVKIESVMFIIFPPYMRRGPGRRWIGSPFPFPGFQVDYSNGDRTQLHFVYPSLGKFGQPNLLRGLVLLSR